MAELIDLKKTYGSKCVLDIPVLQFQDNGRYALIGANGAGKTTLLRALLAHFQSSVEPTRLGYLPQKPYAFSMSVQHNIELGIPIHTQMTHAQKKNLVELQLAAFDLESLAHQRADRLSGGETQRMALARILVVPRHILLLDEPTNSMDLNSLQLASQAVRQYLDQNPCLMLLVSHQLSLVRQLTDELLFLNEGRLTSRGPTAALLDNPENDQLRQFLQIQWNEVI